MWFVVIGCLLLAMKLTDFGFAAEWSWLWILAPFGLATAWWTFADAVGMTKRREMDKMDERKQERRRKHMEALGLNWRRDRRVAVIKETRAIAPQPLAAVKKTEDERHNRDVITAFLPSRQELPPQRADDKAG